MPLHKGFITPQPTASRAARKPAGRRNKLAVATGMALFGIAVAIASGALMFAMLYGASLAIK